MPLIEGLQDEQKLVEQITSCYNTDDWSDEMLRDFLYELIAIGIRNAADFTERFTYTSDSHQPFADFTWFYYWDLKDLGDELTMLHGIVIDYQRTWDCYLSHRYQCFRFNGQVHFYRAAYLEEH